MDFCPSASREGLLASYPQACGPYGDTTSAADHSLTLMVMRVVVMVITVKMMVMAAFVGPPDGAWARVRNHPIHKRPDQQNGNRQHADTTDDEQCFHPEASPVFASRFVRRMTLLAVPFNPVEDIIRAIQMASKAVVEHIHPRRGTRSRDRLRWLWAPDL